VIERVACVSRFITDARMATLINKKMQPAAGNSHLVIFGAILSLRDARYMPGHASYGRFRHGLQGIRVATIPNYKRALKITDKGTYKYEAKIEIKK
jgi:hypothetical protein